jgi:hypothetical protein
MGVRDPRTMAAKNDQGSSGQLYYYVNPSGTPGSTVDANGNKGNGNGDGNTSSTTPTPTPTTNGNPLIDQFGADFTHCVFNSGTFPYQHAVVGNYNFCVGTGASSNKILFQPQISNLGTQFCFYPTTDGVGGGTIMVGTGQCYYLDSTKILQMVFTVNRSGFSGRPIQGALGVKNILFPEITPFHNDPYHLPSFPQAYEDCMNYLYYYSDTLACQQFASKGQAFQMEFAK